MALETNIAHADSNTSNEPVVTTQQANASTQQTTNQQEQVNVQPENTIGMSSNVASNPIGSYNKDNVGYINPNTEIDVYNNQPTHHLSHQGSYKYPYKLLDKFAQKDDLLKKNMYGTPDVYEYLGDSNNPYKNVKPKQITEIKSKINTDITVHYLNNGVSNSIQITNTQGDHNYEAINSLSQALSYADYKLLTDNYSQPRNDQNYGRFFDGNKPIVTPSPVLSTQDLDALYKVAYKNRPIITFDGWSKSGHHITSFLQASISSVNDGWNLTFDNGWRGYTFMDGRQIAFVETNKTRGILRNKGKNFSWKNTVLKYFAESLAYKNSVAEEVDQNTPYMLVGRNYIPVTDILTSRTLNRLENPFNVSPTEIIFAKKGVYAIINGAMGGYNPILVQVPMAFLKSEFQAFYGTNEEPKKTDGHHDHLSNIEDIEKDNRDFIDSETDNPGDYATSGSQGIFTASGNHNHEKAHDNFITHIGSFFADFNDLAEGLMSKLSSGLKATIDYLLNIGTEGLKVADDIASLKDDLHFKVSAIGHSGAFGLFGDFTDLVLSNRKVKEAEDNNGGKGNRHEKFNNVRNAHLTRYEKFIQFLQDAGDAFRDKVAGIPAVILFGITGLIALLGCAGLATIWSGVTGEDNRLLKRFKLKRKK